MGAKNLVIGIDGGGSHTRIAVSDTSGKLLTYYEYPKSASLYKDKRAKNNVHTAIHAVFEQKGLSFDKVCGLTAGIAGFDSPEDLKWVQELTEIQGLDCTRWNVNDAVVAHYGALVTRPGVIVISGTGSILFGINEQGASMRNYDYHHYANSTARSLSYEVVYEVLANHTDDSDRKVIEAMLKHWKSGDLDEFNQMGLNGFHADTQERNRIFAAFAPVVTQAAMEGSTLAMRVCDRAIHQIVVGVKLLSRNFSIRPVPVACIGGVVHSPYFQMQLNEVLKHQSVLEMTAPQFPPAIGAVLYTFEKLNLPVTEEVISNLLSAM